MTGDIQGWRAEIDQIDGQLLQLLNRRARLATRIGTCKRAAGLPVMDPQREREVLARACAASAGPLSDLSVARIFRRIIQESRRLELDIVGAPARSATGGGR